MAVPVDINFLSFQQRLTSLWVLLNISQERSSKLGLGINPWHNHCWPSALLADVEAKFLSMNNVFYEEHF